MQRIAPGARWRRIAVAVFGFVLWFSSAAAQDHGVAVSGAWIREAPPGMAMLGGYFKLSNRGENPRALIGARSVRFGSVEMHVTRIVEGVARMRALERVEIGPGETVAFEPGGRHLMLMRPAAALKAGDCVVVTLLLDGGEEIDVRFELRRE